MLNKIQLIGRIGRDPESRTFTNGGRVVSFSVATTERWKTKEGEKKEHTEWHRVQASGPLANVVMDYSKKGDLVYVEGSLRTKKWNKDGEEKSMVEVQCLVFRILDGKRDENSARHSSSGGSYSPNPQQTTSEGASQNQDFDDMDDDIPF